MDTGFTTTYVAQGSCKLSQDVFFWSSELVTPLRLQGGIGIQVLGLDSSGALPMGSHVKAFSHLAKGWVMQNVATSSTEMAKIRRGGAFQGDDVARWRRSQPLMTANAIRGPIRAGLMMTCTRQMDKLKSSWPAKGGLRGGQRCSKQEETSYGG